MSFVKNKFYLAVLAGEEGEDSVLEDPREWSKLGALLGTHVEDDKDEADRSIEFLSLWTTTERF